MSTNPGKEYRDRQFPDVYTYTSTNTTRFKMKVNHVNLLKNENYFEICIPWEDLERVEEPDVNKS